MPEEQLIDIKEVAETLGKSVESIRKYKNFGIIRVTDKRGNKDLFDRDEVLKIRERLRELRLKGLSLSQIADQLAIARQESMGGGVAATSGTAAQRDPDQPMRILIVDDEEEVRASMREYLESNGFAIVEAADGEEALAKAFTEST